MTNKDNEKINNKEYETLKNQISEQIQLFLGSVKS